MARKVFISVLGAGLYENCKYSANGFCSSETRYVQLATLEYLKAQEWPQDSKAFFLLTDKAKSDNWIVEGNQRFNIHKNQNVPYPGLYEVLLSVNLPFQIEAVSIPDGKDESEMWQIFETTYRLLKDGDELYFDLTHSFRYLPMLILVLGNYAKFLKRANVCSITYGNYEARNFMTNEAPIVNLLPLSSLQDWTFATADYLKNGFADRLVELSDIGLNPLMRHEETRTVDAKRLKSFVNNLKSFSSDMQTCRGINVIKALSIKNIKLDIDSLHKVVIPQLDPVLQLVRKSVESFDEESNVMNTFKAAQWCFDNQQYQQATTFLEEGIISYLCDRHGIDLDDHRKRELITSAFTIIGQQIPSEKWRVEETWRDKLCEIVDDDLMKNDKLVKLFNSFVNLRNDYNHCGMRKSVLKPKQIKERIEQSIKKIIPLLDSQANVYYNKGISSFLINFSNHPSEYWEEKQMKAAQEYGEIIDIPFPVISPDASDDQINELSNQYVNIIMDYEKKGKISVHIMGEMTFTYMVISQLKGMGIECIASTSDRIVQETADGKRLSDFHFVRFRRY